MKRILLMTLLAVAIGGCATKQQQPDPRVGTDLSPYRSIANYAECGDCRMPQK